MNRNARLIQIVSKVAELLGTPWVFTTPEDPGWSIHVDRPDGAQLYFSLEGSYENPNRINISGSLHIGGETGHEYVTVYDRGADGKGWERVHPNSINVSISRGEEVIVSEINRRLLPEYERVFALALAQVAKDKAYKLAKEKNLAVLAAIAGETIRPYQGKLPEVVHVNFKEAYGTISASDSTAQIELRALSIEQAIRVLEVLQEPARQTFEEFEAEQDYGIYDGKSIAGGTFERGE